MLKSVQVGSGGGGMRVDRAVYEKLKRREVNVQRESESQLSVEERG